MGTGLPLLFALQLGDISANCSKAVSYEYPEASRGAATRTHAAASQLKASSFLSDVQLYSWLYQVLVLQAAPRTAGPCLVSSAAGHVDGHALLLGATSCSRGSLSTSSGENLTPA